MTRDEIRTLLAVVASFDTRKTFGAADVDAWQAAISDEPSYDDTHTAVIEHYRHETRMVMPADVRTRCRALREDRRSRQVIPQLLPPNTRPMPDGWREQVLQHLPARSNSDPATFADGMHTLTDSTEETARQARREAARAAIDREQEATA